MRCAEIDRLVDAYVDSTLAPALALELEGHVHGCSRCREALARARGIREAFASAAPIAAPDGFADRVMARVYRQALGGAPPRPADETAARARAGGEAAARTYRRLGFSFMLTAGVLAASLLVPRAAYTGLLGSSGTEIARGSTSLVQTMMTGAGDTVRGALGEEGKGGNTR
jgi:anti-sigma factor RsiW